MTVDLTQLTLLLLFLSWVAYFALAYVFPVRESQETFMDMYVPPNERKQKRFEVAFFFLRVALFLWIFRAFSWIGEKFANIEVKNPIESEEPLIEISNYAMGAAYLLIILSGLILLPYIRRKLVRDGKLRKNITEE